MPVLLLPRSGDRSCGPALIEPTVGSCSVVARSSSARNSHLVGFGVYSPIRSSIFWKRTRRRPVCWRRVKPALSALVHSSRIGRSPPPSKHSLSTWPEHTTRSIRLGELWCRRSPFAAMVRCLRYVTPCNCASVPARWPGLPPHQFRECLRVSVRRYSNRCTRRPYPFRQNLRCKALVYDRNSAAPLAAVIVAARLASRLGTQQRGSSFA